MISPQNQGKDQSSTPNQEQSRHSTRISNVANQSNAQRVGPSCPPSRLSEISNRPFTAVSAPTNPEPHSQHATLVRPSTASATRPDFSSSSPLRPPVYFQRPDSASESTFLHLDRPIATIEHPDSLDFRPQTSQSYDHSSTAELPPRRELPFSRDSLPTSSGSDHNRPTSRPSTALMGPPPLPSRVSDLRPSSARAISLDSELPPLRQPTIVAETASSTCVNQRPTTPVSPPKMLSKTGQTELVLEDRQTYSSASSSPQTYSTSRPLTPISKEGANQGVSRPPDSLVSPSRGYGKVQLDHTRGSFLSDDEENALKAYAMQSNDGRNAALNSFILKNLNDDDFLKLVEDMEANCARIGLGPW